MGYSHIILQVLIWVFFLRKLVEEGLGKKLLFEVFLVELTVINKSG